MYVRMDKQSFVRGILNAQSARRKRAAAEYIEYRKAIAERIRRGQWRTQKVTGRGQVYFINKF